ncbi:MAG: ester cyclase [Sphingomonas paucimobilis]
MSIESNKALALAYFPAFRDRDEEWWDAHIAAEFVRHDPGLDFPVVGLAGIRKLASVLHGGFSDIDYPIVQVVAEGDRVLVQLRQVATHSGEYEGTPATGMRTDIEVMDLFRVDGDKLAEHWALMDNLNLLKQIGAVEA